MPAKLLSRRDLEFLLYEWLDVVQLCQRPRFADHARETFDAALDAAERIAEEQFLPHRRRSDLEEPEFDGDSVRLIPEIGAAWSAFAGAGLLAAAQDYELGGMQLPAVVDKACFAYFLAANVGTASYPLLTIGNANLLLAHGSTAQVDAFVRPMLEGRFAGTMCLSEPQAGSSLADLATRAEPDGESALGARYRLIGNKMWISAGEHQLTENIVHLVLARIAGGPPGARGISLFAVPRLLPEQETEGGGRNDVALAGLNHKMGYRGTVNTVLNFGEGRFKPGGRPGAIGYLVGQAHQGLACMFHMMNEARIGVGLGAVALGYAGYLESLEYARDRLQGRPLANKDPAVPQVPILRHADVRRMLLAQKSYVEGGLALNLYCARLVDEERSAQSAEDRESARLLLEILTPIAKSWPAQWCLAANDLAIQVLGGYGYTRDYPVEQLYRDNRLNPIHEGTHGIQALDLLGRKVTMHDGRALQALRGRIEESIVRAHSAADPALDEQAAALTHAVEELVSVTARLHAAGDIERTLANASLYLEAAGHVVIAWMWLEQACASVGKTDDFYQGKRQAARYFFRWELPRTGPQFSLLASLDTTTLAMRDEWF
ncbi:MAG TPA: acyl-CoA dehydrogenase [Steroidobacteraceae bacterium]|nr:acyl-CoA dehydrogenase [Steroidobacteraceae bacterium]